MSMYNQILGTYPFAKLLYVMMGFNDSDKYPVGRIRDVYLKKYDDDLRVVLFTRNGGGNREEYQDVIDALAKHPCYIRDYDDDFDTTYAYIEFSTPEIFRDQIEEMYEIAPEERGCKMFMDIVNRMENPEAKDDVFVKRCMDLGNRIIDSIKENMGDNGVIEI